MPTTEPAKRKRPKRPMDPVLRDALYSVMDAYNYTWFDALKYVRANRVEIRDRAAKKKAESDAVDASIAAWTHPIGTPVTVRLDSGKIVETTTRSMAVRMSSGHASIWVEGIVGSYRLDRVTVAPPKEGQ